MGIPITIPLTLQGHNAFDERVEMGCCGSLHSRSIERIQVNIGLTCDLACRHCHVESSPKRTEQMDWQTMLLVLWAAEQADIKTLDITGGAPKMNSNYRRFVTIARVFERE
jgi:molybdenum cofactor biosynthesis enzyme MoaA